MELNAILGGDHSDEVEQPSGNKGDLSTTRSHVRVQLLSDKPSGCGHHSHEDNPCIVVLKADEGFVAVGLVSEAVGGGRRLRRRKLVGIDQGRDDNLLPQASGDLIEGIVIVVRADPHRSQTRQHRVLDVLETPDKRRHGRTPDLCCGRSHGTEGSRLSAARRVSR